MNEELNKLEKKHQELAQLHTGNLKKVRLYETQEESLTNALRASTFEVEEYKRRLEENTELLVMTTMELDQMKSLMADASTSPSSPVRQQESAISVTRSYNLSDLVEPGARFEIPKVNGSDGIGGYQGESIQSSGDANHLQDGPRPTLASSIIITPRNGQKYMTAEKGVQTDEYGCAPRKASASGNAQIDKKLIPMRLGAISKQIKDKLFKNSQADESFQKQEVRSGAVSQRTGQPTLVPKLSLKPQKEGSPTDKVIPLKPIAKIDKDATTTPLKSFLLERQLRNNIKGMLAHSPEPTKMSRQTSSKNYRSQDASVNLLAAKEKIVFNSRENSVREGLSNVVMRRDSYEKPAFGSPQIKNGPVMDSYNHFTASYRAKELEVKQLRGLKDSLDGPKDRRSVDFQVFIQNKLLLNKPPSAQLGAAYLSKAVERKNTSPIQIAHHSNSPNKIAFAAGRRLSRQITEQSMPFKFEPPVRMSRILDSSGGLRDPSKQSLH